jgi:hypothetical protein
MNTVVKKFALVALCTTAMTAVSQTSQAAVVFDITGGTVPLFVYSQIQASDNVVNNLNWLPTQLSWTTGSTVYDGSNTADWKGSTAATSSAAAINAVLSVTAPANEKYSVIFTYAGSEAADANVFSVASAANVLSNGATTTSTGTPSLHNLNSNYGGNPQHGTPVGMGAVDYVNSGAGGNIPGFTLTDATKGGTVTNGGANAVPNNGAASLIFAYLTQSGGKYYLTNTPTDFVAFGFNDNGAGDDNHDDFVGIAALVDGGPSFPTPIPGALPLFGSVLGGGFLFRKLRKRRQAKAQLATV